MGNESVPTVIPKNGPDMLAAIMTAPRCIELRRVPRPEPGPTQIRVRLEGCGIGAADLAAWEGGSDVAYPLSPGAPGREGWGRVDAVGAAVSGFLPGERVAVLSSNAWAEYDVAAAPAVLKIPDDGTPFPAEPLGCAMNILRRAAIRKDDTVAVVGVGFLGAILIRLATLRGARVIAVSRRAHSLEVAARMGACLTLPLRAETVEAIRVATCGRLCDTVVEATGHEEPLEVAAQLTRQRGRLVIAGYHAQGSRRIDLRLWNRRGLDVVNAHESDTAIVIGGMRRALDAVRQGALDIRPLCTHSFPLARLGEALELAVCRPPGFVKALIHDACS